MSLTQSLVITLLLIALNAFFSAAEIALAASRRIRLRQMAAAGDARAEMAAQLQAQPGDYFTVVQIAQNAVAILGGIVGESALNPHVQALLLPFLSPEWAARAAFALSFTLITSLFLVLADLLPRRASMAEPERVAVRLVRPMVLMTRLCRPVVWFYATLTNWLLALAQVPTVRDERVTYEDILALTEAGTQAGVLDLPEQRVIENLFELNTRPVTSAMTPRDRIAWFDHDVAEEALKSRIVAEPFSTYPVCDGAIDHVLGYVDAKELLQRVLTRQAISLRDLSLIHKALVVPDRLSLAEVLGQFRQAHEDFAIIVNEYSLVVGVITLNDVMSTVMGELVTQDDEEELIVRRDNNSWLIDGATPISEVARAIHVNDWPHDDAYETLAGFLMVMLRRVPKRTDTVSWAGYRFEVLDVDNYRIDQIMVSKEVSSAKS